VKNPAARLIANTDPLKNKSFLKKNNATNTIRSEATNGTDPNKDETATNPGERTTNNPSKLIPFQKKIIKMKEIKMNEVPISGSSKIKPIGIKPIANAIKISLNESILLFSLVRKFASKSIVPIFANSEGWNPNGPKASQLLAPDIFLPITRTTKRKIMDRIYPGIEINLIEFVGIA
jgi:hypothetical protein